VAAFGSEIKALEAEEGALAEVVGPELAHVIRAAQEGQLGISAGAGGVYGRVML
jgi:PHP family Zn ribbon phosphoesterase